MKTFQLLFQASTENYSIHQATNNNTLKILPPFDLSYERTF